MNFLDVLFLIPLIYGAYKGFNRGFIHQALYIVGLLFALFACFNLSTYIGVFLQKQHFISEAWIPLLSMLLTFAGIFLCFKLIAGLITKTVKFVGLSIVNQLAGAFLGALKMSLILCTFVHYFSLFNNHVPILKAETLNNNYIYRGMLLFSQKIIQFIN